MSGGDEPHPAEQSWTELWARQYRRPRPLDRIWPLLNFRTLFAAMLIVHLLPIWVVTYFPSQDGPAHIYNAKILLDSLDPANFQIRQLYSFNYALHPNILTHLILAPLLVVFPPLLAEKILLSLLVSLLPLSMLYLLRGMDRPVGADGQQTTGLEVFSLIGFLLAWHNLLHMGFYNFSMSVPLCLFALGWWWRHRDQMTAARIGVFYLLALLTWSAHFAGFAVLLLVILVTAGWSLLLRIGRTFTASALRRPAAAEPGPPTAFWANAADGPQCGPCATPIHTQLRFHLRGALIFAGYMLPALAMAWDYNFRTRSAEADRYPTPELLDNLFWNTLALVSYSDWLEPLAPLLKPWDINIVIWVTAAVAAGTIVYRLAGRQWLSERDGILITCAILTSLFFTLPRSRNAGGWVNDRIYILALVLVWMWFGRFHKPFRIAIGTILIGLSLLHTGRLTYDYIRLQPELREFTAAVDLIEPHSTVNVDINRRFRPNAFPRGTANVGPFWHAHAYYGLGRDIALFNNYEAAYSYFFTDWGETRRQNPDYLVAWGHPLRGRHLRQYADEYETIHSSENLTLLRLRRAPPDMGPWIELEDGRSALRLRMLGPRRRAALPTGYIAVPRNRLFASGSYGWVRNVPRREWRGQPAAEAFGDLVGDSRDRAFRIDLPNGRYHVTWHFAPHPDGSYKVNVIANGQRVVRRQRIEEDQDPLSLGYTLEVTGGHLTQVFHTTQRRSADRRQLDVWALAGIEIEQADPR